MIPKIIHYCWFGGAEKPASVKRCIKNWKKTCPDYEIREWTEKDFDIRINDYCREAYEAKVWGFVPDYIRLWIIYHCGGIYLDTDVQILNKFDSLLDLPGFCGFETKADISENAYYVNFGQGFAAEKGNPIIEAHLRMYDDLHFVNPDGTQNRLPSPSYTTSILEKFGLDRTRNVQQNLGQIMVFPTDYFCPKSFQTGIITTTKNTYSIHHFDGSWCDDSQLLYKKNRWKKEQLHYWLHLPNRLLCGLLGKDKYEKVKKLMKRGK